MGFYANHVLPRVIDLACGAKPISRQRAKIVPLARGRVLEVGMGSGHNLPYYDAGKVEFVWGLEPSRQVRARAAHNLQRSPLAVHWLDLPGECIPLADASVDTVLVTYTLCTIPDCLGALAQMRRVLRPGGKLLFCEHGAAPDPVVRRWQDRLDGVWPLLCGGCHLNRDIPQLLQQGGFQVDRLETMYLPGTPRFGGYNYWGEASCAR